MARRAKLTASEEVIPATLTDSVATFSHIAPRAADLFPPGGSSDGADGLPPPQATVTRSGGGFLSRSHANAATHASASAVQGGTCRSRLLADVRLPSTSRTQEPGDVERRRALSNDSAGPQEQSDHTDTRKGCHSGR